ncbi:MAG: hypothetical protein ACYTGV_15970 [Planctomycetota bacterium]|jgi:hypothetical protein
MSPKAGWYGKQASKAPWQGTVGGRPAYIARWKKQWELCCRVSAGKDGVVMYKLTNRAAIRNLAESAAPPIPDSIVSKLLKAATRDEPIRRRMSAGSKFLVAAVVLLAAAAAVYLAFPEVLDELLSAR